MTAWFTSEVVIDCVFSGKYSTLPLMHFALPQWWRGRERGRGREGGEATETCGESQKRGVREKKPTL